jgi:hypothetical protein
MTFKNGDLRVWHIQNPPTKPTWYDVSSPEEGARKVEELAQVDLANPRIWGNAIGLSVYEDGDWVDWFDDDGDDIDTWTDKHQ